VAIGRAIFAARPHGAQRVDVALPSRALVRRQSRRLCELGREPIGDEVVHYPTVWSLHAASAATPPWAKAAAGHNRAAKAKARSALMVSLSYSLLLVPRTSRFCTAQVIAASGSGYVDETRSWRGRGASRYNLRN